MGITKCKRKLAAGDLGEGAGGMRLSSTAGVCQPLSLCFRFHSMYIPYFTSYHAKMDDDVMTCTDAEI
jgi:hypothetical protein